MVWLPGIKACLNNNPQISWPLKTVASSRNKLRIVLDFLTKISLSQFNPILKETKKDQQRKSEVSRMKARIKIRAEINKTES